MEPGLEQALASLHWLGHAGFCINSAPGPVYIDPFRLTGDKPAAWLLLLTHDHFDHYSPEDAALIRNENTTVVAPESVAALLGGGKVKAVRPGDELVLDAVKIKATPAYNINKDFHPRAKNWVGYLVEIEGITYYHAGDADFIPEMKTVRTDIALLPVSGTYVMTAEEAALAALAINPSVAVPMHYGSIVGSADDAEYFARQLQGKVAARLLTAEK
ncbi:MAG: MBL fold metallo-hydrolase [Desulfarculales bacterium]|jgi:L-ascorbate metabolism protein UlaG (beta-lactamase superfamily)|nr:MBL fold metallo-hydrolase [Desulfarculales bacterium]